MIRGRGGRPRTAVNKPPRITTSFKWVTYHERMAHYLKDNYSNFKGPGRKITFLRKMRDILNIDCDDDKKLSNAFDCFLKKYTDVKAKLNSSGFGIDPEKDATLNYGWITKCCPYYHILDEVMGTRPNVTPPAVVSTATPDSEADEEVSHEDPLHVSDEENFVDENLQTQDDNQTVADNHHNDVGKMVKDAFRGLRPLKVKSKDPISAYTDIMTERMQMNAEVEKQKLKFDEMRHEDDLKVRRERNEIELLKVNSQLENERKRLKLEEDKLADKAAEREHEMLKLRMQHEFELKKLDLQLNSKNN